MEAAALFHDDGEATLMLHFGISEVVQVGHILQGGETVPMPAIDLGHMAEAFGHPFTHIQFVLAPRPEDFQNYASSIAQQLGYNIVEAGEISPS